MKKFLALALSLIMGVSTDQAPVIKAIIVVIIVVVQAPVFKAWMQTRSARRLAARAAETSGKKEMAAK